jgi:hypothetical protein
MPRVVASLMLLSLFVAPRAHAVDALLLTIDTLAEEGRCEEALALLEHAEGTRAELVGRRALCEARLGRTEDAVAHVAEALRSPTDAWVAAHRDALLATLRAPAPAAPVVQPVPPVRPVAPAPTTPRVGPHGRAHAETHVVENPYYYASVEDAESPRGRRGEPVLLLRLIRARQRNTADAHATLENATHPSATRDGRSETKSAVATATKSTGHEK